MLVRDRLILAGFGDKKAKKNFNFDIIRNEFKLMFVKYFALFFKRMSDDAKNRQATPFKLKLSFVTRE